MNTRAKSYLIGVFGLFLPWVVIDTATGHVASYIVLGAVAVTGLIGYLWGSYEVDISYGEGWHHGNDEGWSDGYEAGKLNEKQPVEEEHEEETVNA